MLNSLEWFKLKANIWMNTNDQRHRNASICMLSSYLSIWNRFLNRKIYHVWNRNVPELVEYGLFKVYNKLFPTDDHLMDILNIRFNVTCNRFNFQFYGEKSEFYLIFQTIHNKLMDSYVNGLPKNTMQTEAWFSTIIAIIVCN